MPATTATPTYKYRPVTPHAAIIQPIDVSLKEINQPVVDLRPAIERFGIAIRHQPRGNCATHAVTFLHEYMYASRLLSDIRNLSEAYLDYVTFTIEKPPMHGGENFWALNIGYQKWGVSAQETVPNQSELLASLPNTVMESGQQWAKLRPDFIKGWDSGRGASQAELERATNYLDQGVPVAAGVWWPVNWATQIVNGIDLMKAPPDKSQVVDGHAIALVGYGRHISFPGGGYFIFRNSWGEGFGDEGYGYMPFEYVLRYANDLLAYQPTGFSLPIGEIACAQWVHGSLVEAEYPDRLTQVERKGWGAVFHAKGGTTNWFHLPIPTPVIQDGGRPVLTKVFVLYDVQGSSSTNQASQPAITHLHLYDGMHKVRSFDGLALSGAHSRAIDEANTWYVNPPVTIYSGLGISVGVHFPEAAHIHFATAGADFNHPF